VALGAEEATWKRFVDLAGPVWDALALRPWYVSRPETGLPENVQPGETVVVIGGPAGRAGGTGKTQLAIGFARALWDARAAQR
jgi:hypothetical protein